MEGILSARRYGSMLEHLAARAERAWFYAFDLSFPGTLDRHAQRPKAKEFGAEEMRGWYHGWDPLSFVAETRIDATPAVTDIVDTIYTSLIR
ncbi:hypothetical protein [Nocardia miyunensis]|uniref:hypothetical protein n=1 Tax=Nocardia miyunensis TaxID=282684 RepID=UPI000B20D9A9|nr:hypothetical protein [Nocardia miyunensis]